MLRESIRNGKSECICLHVMWVGAWLSMTVVGPIAVLSGFLVFWLQIALYVDSSFFFFFFFFALSRIFYLYRADRSSKVGENRRIRGKTTWPSVNRTWHSHIWPEQGSNHSSEKPNGLRVNSPIHQATGAICSYVYFTVMRTEHVIWSCIRIKGEISRK